MPPEVCSQEFQKTTSTASDLSEQVTDPTQIKDGRKRFDLMTGVACPHRMPRVVSGHIPDIQSLDKLPNCLDLNPCLKDLLLGEPNLWQ